MLQKRLGRWIMGQKNVYLITWTQNHQGQLCKNKANPLSTVKFITNNNKCIAFIKVSSEANSEEINGITCHTIAPIEVEEIMTNYPMVVLREKSIKKSSRNLVFRSAA